MRARQKVQNKLRLLYRLINLFQFDWDFWFGVKLHVSLGILIMNRIFH